MKILKMSPYFFPEQVAGSYLATGLDEAFRKNGIYQENYVPTPSRGVSKEVRNEYKQRKKEILSDGFVTVYRFPMFSEGKNSIQRAVRYLLVNLIQYHKGSRAEDISLVAAASTPPTQGFLCAKTAKKLSKRYGRKVPFVYNLQDIFPDSLVNAGMTKKGSIIWKIGRKIEDYTYKNADKIIVISGDFKRNIMEKGVSEDKIVVIPNWADTDGIYPVERKDNVLFDKYSLSKDKFYISYSGNIGYSQNMDLLLDTAKEIKDELRDVVFVIVGEGVIREEVEKRIKEEAIDNVVLLPFQPYEDIASVFSIGDVGLIISKSGIGNSSVPGKTWGYMAAEKPILASFDKKSELVSLIESVGCGLSAEANSKEELIEAIVKLRADQSLKEKGKLGKAYLTEELSKEKCTKMFVDTLVSAAEA